MKNKESNIRVIIVVIILAILCVGYFFYLSNRTGKEPQANEVERVTSKDLDKTYPTTPREVILFYNRILLCLYNEKYTIDQQTAMANQIRKLMDADLLQQNKDSAYLLRLQADIDAYKKDEKKILSPTISSSNNVTYKIVGNAEMAYVDASYFIKGRDETGRSNQTYILRKDENGKWKVLGYYQPEQSGHALSNTP